MAGGSTLCRAEFIEIESCCHKVAIKCSGNGLDFESNFAYRAKQPSNILV